MESMTFERGRDPRKSMKIGSEYYRQKKIQAARDQKFEEAAKWRDKEKECLENETTNNRG